MLKSLFDLHRKERVPTLLMSAYFFLVITVFWILKPIKKSLFLGYYADRKLDATFGLFHNEGLLLAGPQAELFAKVLNMMVAALAAALFVSLARRFRRQWLTYVFGGVFCLCFFVLQRFIDQPTAL